MIQQEYRTPVYSGEFHHAMDEKNRVTVPAAWRQRTDGEEFYSVPHQNHDYLIVLPPQEFENVGELVNKNPAISPQDRRVFIRQFYSRARQCVTDRQGRILVPEEHRQLIGLEGEVVLVGGHARFEVWSPARWAQVSRNETPVYQQISNLVGL